MKAKFLNPKEATAPSRYEDRPGEGEWAGYRLQIDNAGASQLIRELRYKAECSTSIENLPIDRLQWTQTRREVGNYWVDEIKRVIGEKFMEPILVVTYDGGKSYKLSDGHHRVTACEQLGFKTIPAIVVSVAYYERIR